MAILRPTHTPQNDAKRNDDYFKARPLRNVQVLYAASAVVELARAYRG